MTYAGTEIDSYLPKNPTVRNSDLSRSLREHIKATNFTGVSVSKPILLAHQ